VGPRQASTLLKTSRALNLTLRPSLLAEAEELIGALDLPDIHITPPAADLPPELAAFSGTWEGRWTYSRLGNILLSRLVVEHIDAESARVVYAWGDDPFGRFQRSWNHVRAQVLLGGTLQWGSPDQKFSFTMVEAGMRIHGEREELVQRGWRIATVTMRRVGR
jgi:hypothetical protein